MSQDFLISTYMVVGLAIVCYGASAIACLASIDIFAVLMGFLCLLISSLPILFFLSVTGVIK
jgi:hypothetical protein